MAHHSVMIQGQHINITLARITYRCGHCLSELRIADGVSLKCTTNPEHRGFVHRKEAARIREQQETNIKQLHQFYQIVDGKVTIK